MLPQAATLLGVQTFRSALGDLEDPRCRPFGAWTTLDFNPVVGLYKSFGMVLHGLPNVSVQVNTSDGWELDRGREALLAACSTMVHANRALQPGEQLQVPVGQPVNAMPMVPIEGDVETYAVEPAERDEEATLRMEVELGIALSSGEIRLRRMDPDGARARWGKPLGRGARVQLNTYRELLRTAVARSLDAVLIRELEPESSGDQPRFGVDVWEARDGSGYFMTSNGIGRIPQRHGVAEHGTDHVELIAAMKAHHPLIAGAIAAIAGHVHLRDQHSGVFRPGDTVGFSLPEVGAAGFVLAEAGALSIAEGPRIHLLELIPAKEAEYTEARRLGSAAFRDRAGSMSPAARAARWKLMLS
jgi:hypothetical protein